MRRSLLAIATCAAVAACGRDRTSSARSLPRAVILLVIDALRADHVSCYGYARATTPGLDQLARDGVLFANAYSAANWTKPSTASVFTGLLAHHHGVMVGHLKREATGQVVADVMSDDLVTLAEIMTRAGYRSAGCTENRHIAERYGFAQGFESYGVAKIDHLANWIRKARGTRLFAFAHVMGPHEPYDPRADVSFAPYREKFGKYPSRIDFGKYDYKRMTSFTADDTEQAAALYDAKINQCDEQVVGPFVEQLRQLDVYDHAWIIVTSDHGEELGEHGKIGHGESLYEESLRVPLIVKPPRGFAGIARGSSISARVSTLSLYATLAEIAQVPVPPGDGMSLLPALRGETLETRPIVAEFGRFKKGQLHAACVIQGSKKLIRYYDPGAPPALFDLQRDAEERQSQDPALSPAGRALESLLVGIVNPTGAAATSGSASSVSPDEQRELEALGYGH
ncbi:MAG: sulfatase [Planctomycetota bacterium]